MAKTVLTNPYISIAGTDLSAYVSKVTLQTTYDVLETTTFGATAKSRVAGLADNSVSLDFIQDFANSAVEQTLNPTGSSLVGTSVAVIINPLTSSTTATNPKFTFNALVTDWTPVNGSVGALSTISVSWPISGAITKANS